MDGVETEVTPSPCKIAFSVVDIIFSTICHASISLKDVGKLMIDFLLF